MFLVCGIALFLVYNTKREIEKQIIDSEASRKYIQLEKLWQSSTSIVWRNSVEEATLNVIGTIKEITGANLAYILLFDIQQNFLHTICENTDSKYFPDLSEITTNTGLISEILSTNKPAIENNLHNPHPKNVDFSKPIAGNSLCSIAIPLNVEGESIGLLILFFDRYLDWNETIIEYFMKIANVTALMIKNKKINLDIMDLAVFKERKRLSQELHDNFSQLISAISMRAESAHISCKKGNLEKTQRNIDRIIATTEDIQKILRSEMIGLRIRLDKQSDLLPLIQDCIEHFTQLSNIPVIFEVSDIPDPVIVPVQVGSQFIRILQESLSNVRRHSKASKVVIRFKEYDFHLRLEIEDNGRGFDPASLPIDRLGLQIIQERAQDVGGKVYVRSSVGYGTSIQVEIPVISFRGIENE